VIALAQEQARRVDLTSRPDDPADAGDQLVASQAQYGGVGELRDGPRARTLVAPLAAVGGCAQLRGVLPAGEFGNAIR